MPPPDPIARTEYTSHVNSPENSDNRGALSTKANADMNKTARMRIKTQHMTAISHRPDNIRMRLAKNVYNACTGVNTTFNGRWSAYLDNCANERGEQDCHVDRARGLLDVLWLAV
jgi:hypothetical protein